MKINWENKAFRGINKLLDLYLAGFLWVVFCIPVVTVGASTTALYYTVRKSIKGDRGYVWGNFWNAFKDHFLGSVKITVIFEILLGFVVLDRKIMESFLQQGSKLGLFYYFFLVLQFLMIAWWLWTAFYRARFTQTWKLSIKNAAILTFAHLPWTIAMVAIVILVSIVVWASIFYMFMMPLLPMVPSLVFFGCDIFLEPIFRRYMSEEDLKAQEELDKER